MKIRKLAIATMAAVALNTGFVGIAQAEGKSASKYGVESRLPSVRTPADVDKLKLGKEEKALAKENLKRVPPTDGWWIMGSSPDIQAMWQMVERWLLSSMYPEFQAVPLSPTNLMTIMVSKYNDSEYAVGLLNNYTIRAVDALGMEEEILTKLHMLDYPESEIWSEEESLIIRFTNAAMDRNVSDELYKEAQKAWGDEKILQYVSWMGFVDSVVRMCKVADIKYNFGMQPPKGAVNQKSTDEILEFEKHQREVLRKMWLSMNKFEGDF